MTPYDAWAWGYYEAVRGVAYHCPRWHPLWKDYHVGYTDAVRDGTWGTHQD